MQRENEAGRRTDVASTPGTPSARTHPGDRPNLAERVAASLGAWAATLALRATPPGGPFFPSDGRLQADASLFTSPAEESCAP